MKRFLDLADFSREEIQELIASRGAGSTEHPEPQALAGKVLGLLFFNPSLRTLASFQAAMSRLGGTSFVITPGQGDVAARNAPGRVMNGAAAEHVREAMPVLASYCDAMGIRAFADGSDLAARPRGDRLQRDGGSVRQAVDQHGVGDQPSVPGARGLEDDGRARRAANAASSCCSWVYHPRALPLAVPAATVHMAAHARHGSRRAAARRLRVAAPIMDKARAAAEASGGAVRETTDRARSAGRRARGVRERVGLDRRTTATPRPTRALREYARRLVRARRAGSTTPRPTATSCIACRSAATSRSRTKCSTARAAS